MIHMKAMRIDAKFSCFVMLKALSLRESLSLLYGAIRGAGSEAYRAYFERS